MGNLVQNDDTIQSFAVISQNTPGGSCILVEIDIPGYSVTYEIHTDANEPLATQIENDWKNGLMRAQSTNASITIDQDIARNYLHVKFPGNITKKYTGKKTNER